MTYIAYLAGPIDYNKDQSWKDDLMDKCKKYTNLAFFDPYAPYKFSDITLRMAKFIYNINMYAINESDLVICRLMEGQQSIGTPIELFYCVNINKPLIILTNMNKSIYMKWFSNSAIIVDSEQDLLSAINATINNIQDGSSLILKKDM